MKPRNIVMLILLLLLFWLGVFAFLVPMEAEAIADQVPATETIQAAPVTEAAPAQRYEADKPYTDAELEMMACVIYQEAGGDDCSDETRLMVGCVVMNRIESNEFPDTMEEVLTAKSQYGRFYWTGIVWPARADKPEEQNAVARAYECAKHVLDGERVLTSDYVWQAEFPQSGDYIEQDGIYFCK